MSRYLDGCDQIVEPGIYSVHISSSPVLISYFVIYFDDVLEVDG